MDKTERDEIDELKRTLLHFLVAEIREHGDQVGPLSEELKRTITEGVSEAIGQALDRFETQRLQALAGELSGPVTTTLKTEIGTLTAEVARQATEALDRARQDAKAEARSTVKASLDGNPTVLALIQDFNKRVAKLGEAFKEAAEGNVEKAADLAGQAAVPPKKIKGASQADEGDGDQSDQADAGASVKSGARTVKGIRLTPMQIGIGVAVLLGMIAAGGGIAYFGSDLLGRTPRDPLAKEPINAQFSAVADRAKGLAGSFQDQAARAASYAAVLGGGKEAAEAARLAARSRTLAGLAQTLSTQSDRDGQAYAFMTPNDAELPEASDEAASLRSELLRLQGLRDETKGRLDRIARSATPKGQNLHTVARVALTRLGSVKSDLAQKITDLTASVEQQKKNPIQGTGAEFARKTLERDTQELERLKKLQDRVDPLIKAIGDAEKAEDGKALWVAIGEASQLKLDIDTPPQTSTDATDGGAG